MKRVGITFLWAGLCWGLRAAALLDSLHAPPGEGLYRLYSTRFEGDQLPPGWVESGGWQVRDGLRPPAASGQGAFAYWNQQTALENTLLEAWVVFESLPARVGLVRRDTSRPFTRADVAGSLGVLDAGAGTLALHAAWDGTNIPPPLVVRRLPFALQAGREYKLALWKTDAGHHGLGVWDTVTGARAVVTTVRRPGHDPGKQLDAPGVWCDGGTVRFTRLDFSTAYPPRVRLLVLGDSNSEGEALKPHYETRYCKLAQAALNGSAVLAARGRETTASLLTRLDHDLDRFQPEQVLVLLGTSELSFESWRAHLDAVLARIQARGAVPVLATLPPADHRADFNRQVNDTVRRLGQPYADFALALSRDPEGLYWKFGLQLDGIHPNAAGNRLLFERLRADVPQLFAPPLPAPPPRYRRVRLSSSAAMPGRELVLPLELTASGHENLLAVSLDWDPAYLSYLGADAGPDLPPGAQVNFSPDPTAPGRLGLSVEWPATSPLPAGNRGLLHLRFLTTPHPPGPRSRVRFTDDPQPRAVLEFGLEFWQDAELTFPHWTAPVAAWSLDGHTEDTTGGGRSGVLTGGTWVPGRLGEGVRLDGAGERVEWPAGALPLTHGGLSVALWVLAETVEREATLLSFRTDPAGELTLERTAGHYRWCWREDAGNSLATVVSPVPARDQGRWVHLAGILDGATWRLFRQGVERARTSALGGPTSLLAGALGARSGGQGPFFAGTFDEVRVFDRALTEEEVAELAGLSVALRGTDEVWMDDALPTGAVGFGHGGDRGEWVSADTLPVSGQRALRSPAAPGLHGYYFGGHVPGWAVEPGDALVVYVYLDPLQPPQMILLQWQDDAGSWEHRAFWGESLWPYGQDTPLARHAMGPLPPAGVWTRLEVPAAWVGLEGRQVRGLGVVAYDGAVHWDYWGRRRSARDETWLTDSLPAGAEPDLVHGQPWRWGLGATAPFEGLPVHGAATAADPQRHGWVTAQAVQVVAPEASLFAWVYLEPGDEPDWLGLEWRDETGAWEHRAWWGEAHENGAPPPAAGWRWMGPLPAAGRWVRLSVPAGLVNLTGRLVTGQAWLTQGGRVWWSRAGMARPDAAFLPPPQLALERGATGGWGLVFELAVPARVTVEGSEDLRSWTPQACFEGAAGRNVWRWPVVDAGAERWFRLRCEP